MKGPIKILPFLVTLWIGCYTLFPKTKGNSQTQQCKIYEVKDSTIFGIQQTTQINFICNGNLSKEYNLMLENPYRKMNFPIITKSTKHYCVGDHYQDLIKQGNIDFYLEGTTFKKLGEEIQLPLPQDIAKYYYTLASTSCTINVLPEHALISYYISIHGCLDTLTGEGGGVLFLGGRLDVLNSKGEPEYRINADNFAIISPQLDTSGNFLFFRTCQMINNTGKDGVEIHDIKMKKKIIDIDYDTTLFVSEPKYSGGNFVLFSITQGQKLREVLVYDLIKKQFKTKSFSDEDEFWNSYISGDMVILLSGGEESYMDTLRIEKMVIKDVRKHAKPR